MSDQPALVALQPMRKTEGEEKRPEVDYNHTRALINDLNTPNFLNARCLLVRLLGCGCRKDECPTGMSVCVSIFNSICKKFFNLNGV